MDQRELCGAQRSRTPQYLSHGKPRVMTDMPRFLRRAVHTHYYREVLMTELKSKTHLILSDGFTVRQAV